MLTASLCVDYQRLLSSLQVNKSSLPQCSIDYGGLRFSLRYDKWEALRGHTLGTE